MIFGGLSILFSLVVGFLLLLCFVFWIWMLVDCIRNERLSGNERLAWALVIFFLYALGGLIYLLLGRKK
jgi:hypothetical protein